ncbi:MAG: phosphomannose isomerase type II C-terminal cupin domain [Candidatus Colwellbacteria bacterium]|nr:phosphomannose isomerase type II C-terminal cupin domain [Candidatus Colwellbacteria bacterium]
MKILKKSTKKPWGMFYDFAESKGKWHLKAIVIKKGHRLSLQRHVRRSELWIIAEGKVRIQKGEEVIKAKPKESFFIPKNETHRVYALSDAILIEVSFGSHNEKDITRVADDYGRLAGNNGKK